MEPYKTHVWLIRPMNIAALMGLGVVAQIISPGSSKIGALMLVAIHKLTKPALSLALVAPPTGLHFVHEVRKI